MTIYINTTTMAYPVKESQIKAAILAETPNISFAKPFVPPEGYARVEPSEQPSYDITSEVVVEAAPLLISGTWIQQWAVRPMTTEEFVARTEQIKAEIVAATQERLDAFARTRNYDGILSACTYASSTVPKFRDEGQYCVNARDATWHALYQFMAEVEAGQRPVPTGYADVEPVLPALEWPV